MNKLQIKGERNEQNGRRKQKEADETGDRFKCLEGKEEELVGKLQKEFGEGDEVILDTIDEEDE